MVFGPRKNTDQQNRVLQTQYLYFFHFGVFFTRRVPMIAAVHMCICSVGFQRLSRLLNKKITDFSEGKQNQIKVGRIS